MKIILFLFVFSFSSFPCVYKPLYVDLWKVQEYANISSHKDIILRSRENSLKFEKNTSIILDEVVSSSIGGLLQYKITPKAKEKLSKLIIKTKERTITLNIHITKDHRTNLHIKNKKCPTTGQVNYY